MRRYISWGGRTPREPWQEVMEPFELLGQDKKDYPAATADVVQWIMESKRPWFSRKDASKAARKCNLADRHHSEKLKKELGLMSWALEILEVYDYIRSFRSEHFEARFAVNPGLLESDVDLDDQIGAMHPRKFSYEQKQELWFRANGRCSICRIRLREDWHADHIIPWSKGGPTTLENGAALCPSCNIRKHATMPEGL